MNKKQSYGIVSFKDAYIKALNSKGYMTSFLNLDLKQAVLDYGSRTVTISTTTEK